MKRKILFVDDERNILDSFRVTLRKLYKVDTALGPKEGLEKVETQGPFAVVVSDLKMPVMDGITFLNKVQQISPDTVRIMLTGHADMESAIEAVNKGAVFRFLTKPSPREEMIATLDTALKQYALVTAERELLRGTLRGSIKVLTDVLALVNPEAFGRSERVKRLVVFVSQAMELKGGLSLELAAMLSQLGCVTLPDATLRKLFSQKELTEEEAQAIDKHPSVTASLLANIPRMDKVSDIILHQNDRLDEHPSLPVEARILKACLDYDNIIQQGKDKGEAVATLRARQGWYDETVLDVLEKGAAGEEGYVRRELPLEELATGMILEDGLWSLDEVHLVAKGTELSEAGLARLHNFRNSHRLPETLRVLVPAC